MKNILWTCAIAATLALSPVAHANSLKQNRAVMDQVGSRLAFFEHKYGPFKSEIDSWKIFEIGDCEFIAVVDKDTVIKYITLKISKKCDVVPKYSELGAVSKLRMKDFYTKDNEGHLLKPSCTGGDCGNAADPTITYLTNGPHVAMFISRIIETDLPADLGTEIDKVEGANARSNGEYHIERYASFLRDSTSTQKVISYGEGYSLDDKDIVQ
jgi:hypothetical protein